MDVKLISVERALHGGGRQTMLRVHCRGQVHLACELEIAGASRFVHDPAGNSDAGGAHTWAETYSQVTGLDADGTALFSLA